MKLLPHQVKFAKGYPDKGLLAHEGGTGKTICACVWLHDGRDEDALVVCPKRVVRKWKAELKKWGTKATVVSQDSEFKNLPIKKWSAHVIDEADEFASPLFLKGRSKRSEVLFNLTQAYPDTPTLLLTATPIRSTPWNLHTLLCFYGRYIDWKQWRSAFFNLESRPFLRWKAWFPKEDWRTNVRTVLEKYADIVLLRDCVDYLPPITEEVVKTPPKVRFSGSHELTSTARFIEEHKYEQVAKPIHILNIAKEYRKVLVVAYYVSQVEELNRVLGKDRQTFMVHGGVKDQEEVLEEAQASDECFLIVQASLGAGFDANTFSCIIFTSMSYKVRDFVQMKYRVRRIHDLHPVIYYYLMGGKCDKQVYDTIQKGRDFVPSEWQASEVAEGDETARS